VVAAWPARAAPTRLGPMTSDAVTSDAGTSDAGTAEPFDLIIVGSGSGNAIPDHLAGWRIALVDRGPFGGTCLNRGCIPSKMLVVPADVVQAVRHADRLGLDLTVNGADWPAIRDRVFARIDPIVDSGRRYRESDSPNVTLIHGTARFVGERVLDVDGRVITAPKIVLAAGSRPVVPPIEGLSIVGFHTSDTIMRLDEFPHRLGIIGGGYIATEMAHVFDAFGAEVSVFNRSERLLGSHDRELADRFTDVVSRRFDLRLGHLPDSVERVDDGIVVRSGGDEVVVDELLVATGRQPNSDLLDVDAGGIECHLHGHVVVDDTLATCVEGVYAVGDLANSHELKHVANAEARVAFWNVAHPDELRTVDHSTVPAAVFTDPQVAAVGLTSAAAEADGVPVLTGRCEYGDTAYGWALEDDTSFAKVLVHPETDRIVGAHIMGPQAATLIQPLVQAMQFGQTATDVARGVYYIHPALSEVVENGLLAAIEQR
jgi:mycothione reductase